MGEIVNAAGDAQLSGPLVRLAPLVFFDFMTQPQRLWPGLGPLVAAGYTWTGTAGVGRMSIAGQAPAGIVEEITFSLAAAAGGLLDAADVDIENQETIGRTVQVWLQQMDVRFTNDWQTLGDPRLYFEGTMGPIVVERSIPDDAGIISRVVSVTAQNVMKNFGRPPLSYFSDEDQAGRSSDGLDAICSQMQTFANGDVRWPQFS